MVPLFFFFFFLAVSGKGGSLSGFQALQFLPPFSFFSLLCSLVAGSLLASLFSFWDLLSLTVCLSAYNGIQLATMGGQAASYYNPGQSFAPPQGPPMQQPPPPQQPQPGYNGYDYNAQQPPQQPPPQQYQYQNPYQDPYQKPYQNVDPEAKPPQHPPTYDQAVYGFEDAFKIEKPKYNDIWAGLLVSTPFYLCLW